MGNVKEVLMSEEGYIKLSLRNRHDVDDYMLELIQQEEHALNCMRKKRSSVSFLYDTSNLISLEAFCSLWIFHDDTLLPFLIKLFQMLDYLEQKYPYVLQSDMIFMDAQRINMKSIILPIHDHENADNNPLQFLQGFLTNLQVEDDALLGWLYRLIRQSLDFKDLLKACEKRNQATLWMKGYHYLLRKQYQRWEQENEARILQYLQKQAFYCRDDHNVMNGKETPVRPNHQDTTELFPSTKHASLTLDGISKEISLHCMIGRNDTCDYILSTPAVSSRHAIIECIGNIWYIQDLNSSNGTKLQGNVLTSNTPVVLVDGDWLEIANQRIQFHEYDKGDISQ